MITSRPAACFAPLTRNAATLLREVRQPKVCEICMTDHPLSDYSADDAELLALGRSGDKAALEQLFATIRG